MHSNVLGCLHVIVNGHFEQWFGPGLLYDVSCMMSLI